jgi:hypothetical protein
MQHKKPTNDDETWHSIFPVENEELVYGEHFVIELIERLNYISYESCYSCQEVVKIGNFCCWVNYKLLLIRRKSKKKLSMKFTILLFRPMGRRGYLGPWEDAGQIGTENRVSGK